MALDPVGLPARYQSDRSRCSLAALLHRGRNNLNREWTRINANKHREQRGNRAIFKFIWGLSVLSVFLPGTLSGDHFIYSREFVSIRGSENRHLSRSGSLDAAQFPQLMGIRLLESRACTGRSQRSTIPPRCSVGFRRK
jgi:ubiquitin C-terminal hydrolase